VVAECAEGVVAPARELARDGEHGALVAEPGAYRQVVGVVGRGGSGGADGGLEQGPAQDTGTLAGEVAAAALAVRGVDGDIEPGVADSISRGGEAAAVTELCPDRERDQWPDP